jgi:translation initiation factor 1
MKDKKRPPLPPPPPPPSSSPFAVLVGMGSPSSAVEAQAAPVENKPAVARGRIDILRNTAQRGGKTVTVLKGFVDMDGAELHSLAKQLQKRCGAGGTVKDGTIEIQGDHRQTVMRMLAEAGYRPVLAGG